jgi:hypothetical protein
MESWSETVWEKYRYRLSQIKTNVYLIKKIKNEAGTKVFLSSKIRTIIISAYNPLRKYTSLSHLQVQVRHPIKLPLVVFSMSSLGSGEPPRADALWGLTDLLLPTHIYCGASISEQPQIFAVGRGTTVSLSQESTYIPTARLVHCLYL